MSGSIDFHALFKASPSADLLLSPDPGFPVLSASDAFLRTSQLTFEEIHLRSAFEVFPANPGDPTADGARAYRSALEHVLRTGQAQNILLPRDASQDPPRNGRFQDCHWSCAVSSVSDAQGQVLYLVSRAEERTGLHEATKLQDQIPPRARDLANLNSVLDASNRALKISEKRFRQLADNTTFGFMICDLKGGISYLNSALQQILGYSADDVVNGLVRWDAITPPGFEEVDQKAVQEIQQRGFCAPFEKAYIAKDGRTIPILVGASALATDRENLEVACFILDRTDHARAEELLRASDLRNRSLIETLPQLVWTCHRDGDCTYLSPQWVAYTGIPEREQLGLQWLDRVMHPEDRERTYHAWMSAVAGKAPYDLEYRLRRHDGVYRWFKTRGIPIRDRTGGIQEWFGTCTDIDDQIRSEQDARRAIEERERMWREFDTTLSNSPDMSYSFGLDGRFTYGNRAILNLLRKTLPELVGSSFHDLNYPPELAEKLERQIQTVIETREMIRDETPFASVSGETRVYEYIFVPVLAGDRVEAVTGSTRDITDRKRAEETLLKNEQRLRFALQAGRMNSWEYGPALVERHAGAWAEGTSGVVEAWNTQTLHRFLAQEDQERVSLLFERALLEGVEVETEIRVRHEGKEDRWLWVRGAPNPKSEAQPRISGLISDITERRVLEDRFRESARLESVGVLAGGIAHDFNNLLTGILGNASLVLEEIGSEHPIAPLMEGVVKASERAAALTNQMLAYSGRGKFVVRQIEISSFIREVSTMIRASVPRHVHLDFRLQEPLPPIQADVAQLQQVIMNLIVNAAEAIPAAKNGEVRVTTGDCDLNSSHISSLRNAFNIAPGRFVCLTVADNGAGMDEETQKRMFDPFFTTKFTGRGLGLSAVLGILRGHQGAIGIESRPGQGTTIRVYLPTAPDSETEAQTEIIAPSVRDGEGAILVVDDEETVRMAARNMLRHSGYQVLFADDGAEAVRIFRERHTEVRAILLDLSMPVLDGESALPLLKAINPDVPIILSTGYSDLELTARFGPELLAGVLQKPYKPAQLTDLLKTALNGH